MCEQVSGEGMKTATCTLGVCVHVCVCTRRMYVYMYTVCVCVLSTCTLLIACMQLGKEVPHMQEIKRRHSRICDHVD